MTQAIFPGLKDFIAEHLRKSTKTKAELYQLAIKRFGYDRPFKNFCNYIRFVKRKKPTIGGGTKEERLLYFLRRNKDFTPLDSAVKFLDNSIPKTFEAIKNLKKMGYQVVLDDMRIFFSGKVPLKGKPLETLEETEIIFGVASDLHFGSKYCQITALNNFCHICMQEGVKYIFAPGDIQAGLNVYPGQVYELYATSAQDQLSSVINNLPRGFKWLMMGGNHDYSFIKRGGINPLLTLQNYRKDIVYLGYDMVEIPILNNVDLRMWHPSGGASNSLTLKLQKGIEQVAYTELSDIIKENKDKPTIRFFLAGHLHVQAQAMVGNIFGAQCGCFESQTPYLQKKALHPNVGGYIIKACLGKNGLLKNFEAKFHMFEEIVDDWKSYDHYFDTNGENIKPIF